MILQTPATADKRTTLFLTMVHLGAAATVLFVATLFADLPDFIDGLPQGMLVASLAMIFRRKLRDEYVDGLWRTGATLAFAAILCGFLVAPIAAALLGVPGQTLSDPRDFVVAAQWPAAVALTAFYLGFYWRMLLGGAGR